MTGGGKSKKENKGGEGTEEVSERSGKGFWCYGFWTVPEWREGASLVDFWGKDSQAQEVARAEALGWVYSCHVWRIVICCGWSGMGEGDMMGDAHTKGPGGWGVAHDVASFRAR